MTTAPVLRNLRLLGWFNFLLDFRPYGPVAILYYAEVSGSFALGMSVFSVAMLAMSLFEVPTGVLSDRVGRRQTVVLGALASFASLVFYALGGSYPVLVIGAVFEGLSRAFYSGNNDALLHDTLTEIGQPEAFQEYLGKVSSMYQFSLGISSLLGGFVAAAISIPVVMWLSVIPQALNVLVAFGFVEPRIHARGEGNIYAHLREAFLNIVRNPRLRTLSAASILQFAIGESAWLFRPVFIAALWPVWAIGVWKMSANLLSALSFYLSGRLIRRYGEFRLMIGGMAISEGMNLAALLLSNVFSPVWMSINSIFYGVNTVAVSGLMQRDFTPQQRATMGSLNSFGGSLAFALVSFLVGGLADRIGATPTLVVITLLTVLPISLFYRSFRVPAAAALVTPAASD